METMPHLLFVSFGVRFSPQERAWLETISRQDSRSAGAVVRRLLRREAERRRLTLPEDDGSRRRGA